MRRSVVTDETLGMRLHEVNRQRAVDRAIERLRHGLHADWHYFTADDHANLRWVLGELWAVTGRQAWEEFHFSKLDFAQTRQLIALANRMRSKHTRAIGTLEMAAEIIASASGRDYDTSFA